MNKAILTIFITIYLISCKKQTAQQNNNCTINTLEPSAVYTTTADFMEIDYTASHCGYLPLSKKNYWVYLDSIFDATGQFQNTVTDTLRFTKTYRTPDGIIWWSVGAGRGLAASSGYSIYNYSTANISFGTTINFGGKSGIKWYYAINTPSVTDTLPYSDLSSPCYAEKLNTPIQTPAGNFSGCMFFNKKMVYGTSIELSSWFKPEIGSVKTDLIQNGVRFRTSTLVSYHIEN